ncbi:MAG: D-Ala-D-Ala carboxypeptidase family metallohydrolase [Rhizobiaceae bacterium]
MKFIILLAAALTLVGCQSKSASKVTTVSKTSYGFVGTVSKRNCKISGLNWKNSDARLKRGLCALSRKYGPVEVSSSCRTRKQNRSVRKSYHLYSRGCKAADVRIKGVSGRTILKWWGRNMGGGRGYYACKSFVHVDTGENRTWNWNLCRKKKRRA